MPAVAFRPTPEQRMKVKLAAALGTPHKLIADMLGLRSLRALRRHFRTELACGPAEADARVVQALYQMATSGQCLRATVDWFERDPSWCHTNTEGADEPGACEMRFSVPPELLKDVGLPTVPVLQGRESGTSYSKRLDASTASEEADASP